MELKLVWSCSIELLDVCVLQTAIDLLEEDYEVHLVCDGVSSQRQFDKSVAIERMRQMGVFLTSFESCVFQIMGSAEHEKFKEISKLCNPKFSGERPDQGSL
jgi:nicotinamidase-related amidase